MNSASLCSSSPFQFSLTRQRFSPQIHLKLPQNLIPAKTQFCSFQLKSCSVVSTNRRKFNLKRGSIMAEMPSMKGKRKIQIFESEEDVAVSLAKYTADLSEKCIREKGNYTVVLSGGTLINSLRKLVEPPYDNSVDWKKWHIFWVDERVVRKTHPDSNYKLAYDGFLSKVPIPRSQVYAINDNLSPEKAADDYEKCLKNLVKRKVISLSKASGFPKFDLMLLGMGPDGHVASLFPKHPLINENKRWVTFIKDSPKPPPQRITFTFPVINSSANIALVVTGPGEANALHRALGSGKRSDLLLPVQMVSSEGGISYFLDEEAASKLLE